MKMTRDRREFLKRSAAAGGLIWAAPALTTIGRAGAQGSPPPGPQCQCQNFAMGLDISGVGTFGQGKCEANVTAGGVTASAVCGTTSQNGDVCRAEASVAGGGVVTPGKEHTNQGRGL